VKLGRVARRNHDESATLAGNLDRLSEQCAFVNDRLSGWNHALKSITQYRQRKCKRMRVARTAFAQFYKPMS
jgi:hypothetical protein